MSYILAGRTLHGAALAPMAGLTDYPLRCIAQEYGAAFTVSEMVSARALVMGDKKTLTLCRPTDGGLYGVQLFGSEPAVLEEAAALVAQTVGPDFLDLNLGCPAAKIVANGCGSALLRDAALCGQLVAAMARSGLPVTVKMRTGFDDSHLNAPEVARACEAAGACLITVHGRTRTQQYRPPIYPREIARVVQAVQVPVLGNGDIACAADALTLMQETGCAGVMVGRSALGNPWLFGEIAAALTGQTPPPAPTLPQRLALLCRQVQGMCEEKGEAVAMLQARGQAIYYLKGLREAASLRAAATSLTTYSDLLALCDTALALNPAQ